MPKEAIGRKIAEEFAKYSSIENTKICLLRARNANRDLPNALEELGAIVDDIGIYKTVAETEDRFGRGGGFAGGRRGLGDVHQRLDGGTFPRAV